MQIFAFEVIPDLSSNKHKCGERRVIELPPPRILKWELTARPRGKTLDKIFTERVSIDVVNVYYFQYVCNYNDITPIADVCSG